ncbi:MAG: hypothetical protein R3C10_04850 [Pirellulales bacterium]|nr:hypothetical protein [Planctomycetales bacterium]
MHKSTGSYADLYNRQLKQTRSSGISARNYTTNQYFYHNPNISPYLNLARPGNSYTPKYQAYVMPEEQRRANAQARYNDQAHPGQAARSTPVTSQANPYYSKYYTPR